MRGLRHRYGVADADAKDPAAMVADAGTLNSVVSALAVGMVMTAGCELFGPVSARIQPRG